MLTAIFTVMVMAAIITASKHPQGATGLAIDVLRIVVK